MALTSQASLTSRTPCRLCVADASEWSCVLLSATTTVFTGSTQGSVRDFTGVVVARAKVI